MIVCRHTAGSGPWIWEVMSLSDWLMILGGIAYLLLIYAIDEWLVESGNRILPADYVGVEPEQPAIKQQVSGQDKDK